MSHCLTFGIRLFLLAAALTGRAHGIQDQPSPAVPKETIRIEGYCTVEQPGGRGVVLTFSPDDVAFLTPEVELLLEHEELRDACEILPAQAAELKSIKADFEKGQLELMHEAIRRRIMNPRAMEPELRKLAEKSRERLRKTLPPHQTDKLERIGQQNALIQLGYPKLLERIGRDKEFNLTAAQKAQFDAATKELSESMASDYRKWAGEKIADLAKVLASEDEQVTELFKYIGQSLPPTIEVFAAGLPTGAVMFHEERKDDDALAVFRYERELSPLGQISSVASARSFARDLVQALCWDKELGLTPDQGTGFISVLRLDGDPRAAHFKKLEDDLQNISQLVMTQEISSDEAKEKMIAKFVEIDDFIMREFRKQLLDFQVEKLDQAMIRFEVHQMGFMGSLFHGALKNRIKLTDAKKLELDEWNKTTRRQIKEQARTWHDQIDEKLLPLFTEKQRQTLNQEFGDLRLDDVSANCPQFLLMDRQMVRSQPH